MVGRTATSTIIDWITSTGFGDLPEDVRKIAQLAAYDGVGCILACSMLPVAHRLFQFIRLAGGGSECSVIGFPQRTSALSAALVNGTLGHADEVDAIDDFNTRGSHVLAACLAAALTAGQLARAPGRETLRGVVLGYEVSKRAHAQAAQAKREGAPAFVPFDEGNTLGAAVAAGVALRLNPDQLQVAISLGGHLACGITPFRREAHHMTKSFTRGGMGAKNGITAALMAKADYDAPRDIFDGRESFFDSYLGVSEPGPEFLAGLGEEFSIRGLIFKRNSSGGGLQAPRQALLEMIAEHGLSSVDIEGIKVEMRPGDIDSYFSSHRHPADCGDALALAALYGGMGFKEAHQERYTSSPEFQDMRPRVVVQPRQDWNDASYRLHTAVTVTTRDGRSFRQETNYRHMTEADLMDKFSYLVGLRIGQPKAEELSILLKNLAEAPDVAEVMAQLEFTEADIEQI